VKFAQYLIAALLVLITVTSALAQPVQLQVTSTNRLQYEVDMYQCLNNDCSAVGPVNGEFPRHLSTTNGQIIVDFADPHPGYGYALLAYAEGFLPKHNRFKPLEVAPGQTVFPGEFTFNRLDVCSAHVDNLEVLNTEDPAQPIVVQFGLSASADADSAFAPLTSPVAYVPANRVAEYYAADTEIIFEVFDGNSNLLYTQTKKYANDFNADGPAITMGETRQVSFSYTPTQTGDNMYAQVSTRVTDDQCAASHTVSTGRFFDVEATFARKEIYTILNNLRLDRENIKTGETLNALFTRISNLAPDLAHDDPAYNSQLQSVPTALALTVEDISNPSTPVEVLSRTYTLVAAFNPLAPVAESIGIGAFQPGNYRLTLRANGVAPAGFAGVENSPSGAVLQFTVTAPDQYSVTFRLTDSQTLAPIANASVVLDGRSGVTDANGRLTLGPFNPGTYSLNINHVRYYPIAQALIVDGDKEVSFSMVSLPGIPNPPQPPVTPTPQPVVQEIVEAEKAADVTIGAINMPGAFDLTAGDLLQVSVALDNNGDAKLTNARIAISVPELGIRRVAGPLDIRSGDSETMRVMLALPPYVDAGSYDVNVQFTSNEYATNVWRQIEVH